MTPFTGTSFAPKLCHSPKLPATSGINALTKFNLIHLLA